MNIELKRAMIRAVIICLLVLALIGSYAVKAGTAGTEQKPTETPATTSSTEEPTQETQPTTEPATIPTEDTRPTQETEAPTDATEPPAPTQTQPAPEPQREWIALGTYKLTAYCPCKQCCGKDPGSPGYGITATGAPAVAGTTIAVDPSVIPYGSKVKINDHIYIAQDCGGAINGNRIDVYFDDHQEALQFGVQTAEVFLQTGAA